MIILKSSEEVFQQQMMLKSLSILGSDAPNTGSNQNMKSWGFF